MFFSTKRPLGSSLKLHQVVQVLKICFICRDIGYLYKLNRTMHSLIHPSRGCLLSFNLLPGLCRYQQRECMVSCSAGELNTITQDHCFRNQVWDMRGTCAYWHDTHPTPWRSEDSYVYLDKFQERLRTNISRNCLYRMQNHMSIWLIFDTESITLLSLLLLTLKNPRIFFFSLSVSPLPSDDFLKVSGEKKKSTKLFFSIWNIRLSTLKISTNDFFYSSLKL